VASVGACSQRWRTGSAKLAFGRYVNTVYRVEKPNVILSLDADFMTSGPGHARYMKDFYKRRNLDWSQ